MGLSFLDSPISIALIPLSVSQWPFLILMHAFSKLQTAMDQASMFCIRHVQGLAIRHVKACLWFSSLIHYYISVFCKCQYFNFRQKDKIFKILAKIGIATNILKSSMKGEISHDQQPQTMKKFSKNCVEAKHEPMFLQIYFSAEFLEIEYVS